MKPGIFDFTIYQGADFDSEIQWISGGNPVDFTGCLLRMQIREKPKSPFIILDLNTDNGMLTIFEDRLGFIGISISSEVTAGLDFKTAHYDLEVIFPGNRKTRLLQGVITLSEEVTR